METLVSQSAAPTPEILVDPVVSKGKFDQQIAEYRLHEDDYIRRGWWMVKAEFPDVFVVFGTPKVRPPAVAFGAIVNFDNYDLWAPSVRLASPPEKVHRWVVGKIYDTPADKVEAVENFLSQMASDGEAVKGLAAWDWIRHSIDNLKTNEA